MIDVTLTNGDVHSKLPFVIADVEVGVVERLNDSLVNAVSLELALQHSIFTV